MKVEVEKVAQKQLAKLPKKETIKVVSKIEKLSQDNLSGKTLHGDLKGFFSLRSWPYRIIYKIENKTLIVYSISHRKSVYK